MIRNVILSAIGALALLSVDPLDGLDNMPLKAPNSITIPLDPPWIKDKHWSLKLVTGALSLKSRFLTVTPSSNGGGLGNALAADTNTGLNPDAGAFGFELRWKTEF